MSCDVAFVSVVPSPYQRDLFLALSKRLEVNLRVFYLEKSVPDSPWPDKPLAEYESILRGGAVSIGAARCQWNWPLPNLRQFDVVVLNTLMSMTAQWLMRWQLRGKPWVFWGERLREGGALHTAIAAPLHRAAGIAAIGTAAKCDYEERFPEPAHFCIPYYCSLEGFVSAPRHPRSDGHIVFLFCGQMIARKGLEVLLAAFQRLGEHARLMLVGREAELASMLSPLPKAIRDRIAYEGFQPPDELPHFFAKADVFVLPSRYDGWGVVVNQALGAGLPVICSDMVGAGHDLVEQEVNGLIFRSGDVSALAAAMQRLITEPALRARWGEASRERAHQWAPDAGAAKWIDAFRTLRVL